MVYIVGLYWIGTSDHFFWNQWLQLALDDVNTKWNLFRQSKFPFVFNFHHFLPPTTYSSRITSSKIFFYITYRTSGVSSKLSCETNLPKCMYTLVGKASVQNYVGQICQSVYTSGKASFPVVYWVFFGNGYSH
jgi:hypothetical protein